MLFKESLNTDLTEIKQYLSVSQNGSFAKIRPHIAAAEILHIKELLGEALFDRLDQWYNSEDSGSLSSSISASASGSASTSASPPVRSCLNTGTPADTTVTFSLTLENVVNITGTTWIINGGARPSQPGTPDFVLQNAKEGDSAYAVVATLEGDVTSNFVYVHELESGELVCNQDEIIIIDDPFTMMSLSKPPLEASGSLSSSVSLESDEALAALLPLVQRVLINFAYYVGADEFSLHITDAGIQYVTDETHKPALQWQVEAAKTSWLNKAYLFSDALLSFLESHKADYPTWVNSESYTEIMDSLLYTTRLFDDAFNIRKSRRLFLALKPIIRSIESRYAAYTLSQEYYDSLLVLLRTSALTADDQVILKKIRPAIAYLAMAEAISRFSIDIFPEGVYSNVVSAFGTIAAKNPANRNDKATVIENLTTGGLAEMQGVQKYLDAKASASKYKLYFESSRYVDPKVTVNRSEFVNSKDKGMLLL